MFVESIKKKKVVRGILNRIIVFFIFYLKLVHGNNLDVTLYRFPFISRHVKNSKL
jgi:hypothetical protein